MKTKFIPISFFCLSLAFLAFRSEFTNLKSFHKAPLNSGGAAAGKTGAPGETNCTDCHSGTTQNGTSENVLKILNNTTPVTQYVPGQNYTVELKMASNPAKKGFQATALTSANTMAGTFTGVTGSTSINGNSRKYANHTATSNTAAVWTWNWTAPSASSGPVTFYIATNKTNNNGNDNGDVIYLSEHLITESNTSGIENITFNNNVIIGIDNESNKITIGYDLNQTAKMSLNVVDLNGKSVYSKNSIHGQIGSNKLNISTTDLDSGIYIVNFFIDNKPFSKKILIK